MLDPQLLAGWLTALPLELDLPFKWLPRVPEFGHGDLTAVVNMLEGPGSTLEGVGDYSSFQLRMYAREHQLAKLRKSAWQVDEALRFGDYPADLWGTWVVSVDRTGGAPSETEADELDRVLYVCSYVALETV